jgi:hypothetical protein
MLDFTQQIFLLFALAICYNTVNCSYNPYLNYAVNVTLQNTTSWAGPVNMGINTVH